MDKDQKGYLEDGITWTLMPDELVKMFIRRGAVREQNGDLAKMVYLDTRRVERAGKVTDFHGGYTSLISERRIWGTRKFGDF
jgi:hypothetical protein